MGELSNSDAAKARIKELRRERTACLGKVRRARDTAFELATKARREEIRAAQIEREIEELGGSVVRRHGR